MLYIQLIGLVWIVAWIHLLLGGARKRTLPLHPALQLWSSMTFVSIFFFYMTFYLPNVVSMSFTLPIAQDLVVGFAFLLSVIGFVLIFTTRHALRHLSGAEVFFSLSRISSDHWVFMYMVHPMYVGIGLVLLGSWLIVPNVLAVVCMLVAIYAMLQKARIEHTS